MVGTLIYLLASFFFSSDVGLVSAIVAGAFKEVYDEFFRTKLVKGVKVKTNDADPWDFFSTIFLPVILFLISTI
jgi:hypothetical protein